MFHYIHCCGSERLDSHCTSLLWGWSYSNHFGLCLTDQDNGGQRVFPDGQIVLTATRASPTEHCEQIRQRMCSVFLISIQPLSERSVEEKLFQRLKEEKISFVKLTLSKRNQICFQKRSAVLERPKWHLQHISLLSMGYFVLFQHH